MSDNEFEPDETFQIELFDPPNGAIIGNMSKTTITITDDDGKG